MKTEMNSHENNKIPWRENAFALIGSYSIFVALVGVLLTAVILDMHEKDNWKMPVILFSISIVCFIWAIEKFNEALDENDVEKYLSWLLAYNIGVITLYFGIAYFIIEHFNITGSSFYVITVVTFIVSSKWFRDFVYLIRNNDKDYEEYKKELLGTVEPTPDPDFLMKIQSFIRRKRRGPSPKAFPHIGSYTRLGCSKIHGIGVFAICAIGKGQNIFSNDTSKMVWFNKREIDELELSEGIKKLYEDFCVVNNGEYGCPENFNSLTVGWYLNQPAEGTQANVYCGEDYDFFASRDIKAGEELTVVYSTYSDI